VVVDVGFWTYKEGNWAESQPGPALGIRGMEKESACAESEHLWGPAHQQPLQSKDALQLIPYLLVMQLWQRPVFSLEYIYTEFPVIRNFCKFCKYTDSVYKIDAPSQNYVRIANYVLTNLKYLRWVNQLVR
jgi:hypothetical protein